MTTSGRFAGVASDWIVQCMQILCVTCAPFVGKGLSLELFGEVDSSSPASPRGKMAGLSECFVRGS